jgi:hypothetical protein
MNKQEHRKDLFEVSRMFLLVILIIFIINVITLSYYNLDTNNFLWFFNGTILIQSSVIISLLDYYKHEIIGEK